MNKRRNVFDSMVTVKDVQQCTTFKDAIDKFLDMQKWTYNEFADNMGYSTMHVHSVCAGRYQITIGFAKKLCKLSALPTAFWLELWLDCYDPD